MADVWASAAKERRLEIGRTTAAILRMRVLFLPLGAAIAFWYWASHDGSRRAFLLLCAFYALVILHLTFLFLQRRKGIQTRSLGIAGTVMLLVLASLTGGLDSPFIIVLPVTATTAAMGGPWRDAWASAILQVTALPLLALVGGSRPLFTSGMVVLGVATAVYVGFILRAMFERMIDRVDQAHEDILRMHSEQMRNLTSLSAEIARELRMPLASIAALAGAVRQQIHDSGGAATQLETVREETAHMQALLEEFLNFSRPLSPLSLRTVDGVRIGGEIVDLFQGVAQQRHLSLAISGQPVELRCDPRKIKQVLINLVQNAVDASHPGGEIAIEIEARSQETAIRVVDRGDGISAEIAQRVFQPGVTTKPRAPGLGLTIARSIAEQHGGTLTLRGREGGGCAAELMLPHAPAPAMEGRAA